jgi:DNA-directed RNA polymerase subunit K/omega
MALSAPSPAGASTIADDYQKIKAADRSKYHSLPLMTKFEFNQVISLRTMHLSRGAPPLVDVADDYTIQTNTQLREIALRELTEGKLPYMVKRPLPNGKHEYYPVSALSLVAVTYLMRA